MARPRAPAGPPPATGWCCPGAPRQSARARCPVRCRAPSAPVGLAPSRLRRGRAAPPGAPARPR
ncbi:Hypothetical protein AA314_09412 [Archangium gephyra]|uniref:Uncharacterized protein n=1 Tax=Archangium gephyra TaxID=48 RepID=A0AAC8TK97_9BACT|nr:Hypothetical protein AA314_09412 [Archangium gephyra]